MFWDIFFYKSENIYFEAHINNYKIVHNNLSMYTSKKKIISTLGVLRSTQKTNK